MSCLETLNEQFPVRNTAEQKQAFRKWAAEQAESAGFAVREEENEGHINLVIGDPAKAKILFTAHYDTPRRSLIPNLMLPTHPILKLLHTLLIVICILAPALLAAFAVIRAMGGFGDLKARLAGLIVYTILYPGLFFLFLRGPANRANKNDNTSGSAAVLDLAGLAGPAAGAAFILFDDEEKGKKGSKAYAAAHPELKTGLLTVNMDCVGNGETFIASVPDGAERDPAWPSLKEALERIGTELLPEKKASLNSDHKNFDRGVGICASLRGKLIGYYTPRIHTRRDTVASGETVDRLTGTLAEFIKRTGC